MWKMWAHLEDAVREGTHRWKQTFGWDGRSDAGTPAPNGAYSFSVTATGNGKSISGDALMLGHVDGVIPGANGTATQLQLGRLGRFDLAQALEIN